MRAKEEGKAEKVIYFEDPRKIKKKFNRFKKQCTLEYTEN